MYEIDLNLPKQIVADVLSNHEIHSVAFVGCGASMSDLYPAKYFLANNTDKLNVQIFTANEFNYDTPSWVNEHTFVITCSLGGSTPETVEANKTAKKHNCPVVSLTNKAGSALTVDADHVIVHASMPTTLPSARSLATPSLLLSRSFSRPRAMTTTRT